MAGVKHITVILILIFALLLSLCSCGAGGEPGTSAASVVGTESTAQSTEKVTAGITTEKPKQSETEKQTEAETASAVRESTTVTETEAGTEPEGESTEKETEKTTARKTAGVTLFKRADKKEPVGDAFFKDAVFIGDSVTMALRNYVTAQRNEGNACLSDAKFLTAGSMGYSNSLLPENDEESIRPKLNGKKVSLADGVKQVGAKKVFIMLGMNDFAAYKHETAVNNAEKAIKNILAKNPNVQIYVQSITPVLASKEHGKFTNDNIDDMNARLEKMCADNGWTYLDVNTVFKDDDGCLIPSYCSDPEAQGIHLTSAGCKKWVECLDSSF